MITKNHIRDLKQERRKPYVEDVYQHTQPFEFKEAQAIREVADIFNINVLISLPDGAVLAKSKSKFLFQALLKAIRTRFIFEGQFAQTSEQRLIKAESEIEFLGREVESCKQWINGVSNKGAHGYYKENSEA